MPIPDFQTIMLPLLRCVGDGQERSVQELIAKLAQEFALSEEEKKNGMLYFPVVSRRSSIIVSDGPEHIWQMRD